MFPTHLEVAPLDEHTCLVKATCPSCGKDQDFELSRPRLVAWADGGKLMELFADQTPSRREALLTGICDKCWDVMFKEDEHDDEPAHAWDAYAKNPH